MSQFKDVSIAEFVLAQDFCYKLMCVKIAPSPDMVKNPGGYEIQQVAKAKHGDFKVLTNEIPFKKRLELETTAKGYMFQTKDKDTEDKDFINTADFNQILEAAFVPNWSKPTDTSVKLSRGLLVNDNEPKRVLAPVPLEGYSRGELPLSYVPSTESLNPILRDLEIGDVLTFLPEAEQGAFALAVGRILTGINGEVHCHTGYTVKTDWRWMIALNGFPGAGKTCLMQTMLEAMKELGYSYANFTEIGSQFGLGSVISRNAAYCDDFTTKSLSRLLSSDLFKIIVTSGVIRTEEKFQAKTEIQSRCVILANINKFDSSILHELDQGSLNRLLILQTHSPFTLTNQDGIELPKLSKGSPHLGTAQHFEWLRETYGVTTQEIFNAFFRKCVDYYLSEINAGTLKTTVNYLKSFFKFTIPANLHSNFCRLMQISVLSTTVKTKPEFFSSLTFAEGMICLNFFLNSKEAHSMRDHLKAHWVKNGRTEDHPWCVLRNLNERPVADAASDSLSLDKKEMLKTDLIVKRLLQYIRLNDGFKISCSISELQEAWDMSKCSISSEFSDYFGKIDKVLYSDNKDFDISHLYTSKSRQEISDEIYLELNK